MIKKDKSIKIGTEISYIYLYVCIKILAKWTWTPTALISIIIIYIIYIKCICNSRNWLIENSFISLFINLNKKSIYLNTILSQWPLLIFIFIYIYIIFICTTHYINDANIKNNQYYYHYYIFIIIIYMSILRLVLFTTNIKVKSNKIIKFTSKQYAI